MVFCAYCGKSFTRKEHLERHIPSHTNVKPHRCSACQLSFARRDLLQRHHSTYHEARDPLEPLPGGVPTVAGRTPIACQNCASAKTGCDKRVPCSRCSEKNLPCAARFARRSSKAAARAAQHCATLGAQLIPGVQQRPQALTVPNLMMDLGPGIQTLASPSNSSAGSEVVASSNDATIQRSPPLKTTPEHAHFSPVNFHASHPHVDLTSEFMHFGNEFVNPDSNYSDVLMWPDYTLDMSPDMYTNPLGVKTDIVIPTFSEFSEVSSGSEPITSSSSSGSFHTRGTSIMSAGDFDAKRIDMRTCNSSEYAIREFEVVIAAENSWPLARCNPPTFSAGCPRTAIVHLEALEQKCKQPGTWETLEKYLDQCHDSEAPRPTVVPITSRTRDVMGAITQGFLHKALSVHRSGAGAYSRSGLSTPGTAFNFIMLPPNKVLEYFLGSYVRSLADYYPLAFAMRVDPNEMLQNNEASTLLVLLMIAQGAAAVPMEEARYLSAGLTETSRISLFDLIEKDVELSADPIALRCALLFTHLGAWSGDKWLMDISMGQRGMYLSMLKHAGMLEPQPSMIPTFTDSTSIEVQWRAWMVRESQNRLVYNWVLLDLELSIFHDSTPLLALSDLNCPLPGPKLLWMASTSEQWLSSVQSIYGRTNNVSPHLLTNPSLTPSLNDLFHDFISDNLSRRQSSLEPQQMRLLLHPLHNMLCHLRQFQSCFPDVLNTRRVTSRTVTKTLLQQRVEEVEGLLQKWYEISAALHNTDPGCAVTRCNLVLYHLISLNAVANFPEVEQLARLERFEGARPTHWELALRHKRCILQREHAIFHCGQVLRLLRELPTDLQPSWWGTALYRVILVLWTDGLCRLDPSFNVNSNNVNSNNVNSNNNNNNNNNSNSNSNNNNNNNNNNNINTTTSRSSTASSTTSTSSSTTDHFSSPGSSCSSSAGAMSPTSSASGTPTCVPTPSAFPVHIKEDSATPTPSAAAAAAVATIPTSALLLHPPPSSPGKVAVDQLGAENPAMTAYLWGGDGKAVLTRADGTTVGVDAPAEVLALGIRALEEGGVSTRIGDGLRRKLVKLAERWNLEQMGLMGLQAGGCRSPLD